MKNVKSVFLFSVFFISGLAHGENATALVGHGAVTAVADMLNNPAAFVGYADGTVAYCISTGCTKIAGTPSSPVTAISSQGVDLRAFVGFSNGEAYLCGTNSCNKLSSPK